MHPTFPSEFKGHAIINILSEFKGHAIINIPSEFKGHAIIARARGGSLGTRLLQQGSIEKNCPNKRNDRYIIYYSSRVELPKQKVLYTIFIIIVWINRTESAAAVEIETSGGLARSNGQILTL